MSGACAPTRKPLEYNLSGRTWCFNHTGESKAQLRLRLDQPGRGKNHHILIITGVPSDGFSWAGDRTSVPLWNRPKCFGRTEFQIKPRLSVPSFSTLRWRVCLYWPLAATHKHSLTSLHVHSEAYPTTVYEKVLCAKAGNTTNLIKDRTVHGVNLRAESCSVFGCIHCMLKNC